MWWFENKSANSLILLPLESQQIYNCLNQENMEEANSVTSQARCKRPEASASFMASLFRAAREEILPYWDLRAGETTGRHPATTAS